jgi:hypothetical protein
LTPFARIYLGQAVKSMQLMNMMHTTTLYTSLLCWMKSGWMQKDVSRVRLLRKQCKRNEELMCNCEVATKDVVPTPATHGGHVPDIPLPDGALISNDDVFFISNTESEGGFGGANADDNGSEGDIPNEGAQGPNFAVDGEGQRRSTRRRDPIERLVPGANNIQGYPETVWKYDANGRLERFNLWTFRQGLTKLAKLNQDVFTLTLGIWQIPP